MAVPNYRFLSYSTKAFPKYSVAFSRLGVRSHHLTLKRGWPKRQADVESLYFGSLVPKLPINVASISTMKSRNFWVGGPISVEESSAVLS
jgi:hypothetical protein